MDHFKDSPVPSPQLMQYFSKLGDEWESIGAHEQAEDYYRKAMKISKYFYGNKHDFTKGLQEKVGGLTLPQSA
ncbi:MAG: hypothetical protein GY786_23460 [Proteobacteria bacterium]|nr:hypothetical protein [Pseudomonadota bacterium]